MSNRDHQPKNSINAKPPFSLTYPLSATVRGRGSQLRTECHSSLPPAIPLSRTPSCSFGQYSFLPSFSSPSPHFAFHSLSTAMRPSGDDQFLCRPPLDLTVLLEAIREGEGGRESPFSDNDDSSAVPLSSLMGLSFGDRQVAMESI